MGIHKFLSSSLVFLVLTTIFLSKTSEANLPSPTPAVAGQIASMTEWCSKTDYPILCNHMMSNIKSGTCKQAAISVVSGNMVYFRSARAFVAELIKKKTVQARQELDVCLEMYGTGIDDLTSSLKHLQSNAIFDSLVFLSAVVSDVSTCDDALTESGVTIPSMTKINNVLSKLGSNSLALATLLRDD